MLGRRDLFGSRGEGGSGSAALRWPRQTAARTSWRLSYSPSSKTMKPAVFVLFFDIVNGNRHAYCLADYHQKGVNQVLACVGAHVRLVALVVIFNVFVGQVLHLIMRQLGRQWRLLICPWRPQRRTACVLSGASSGGERALGCVSFEGPASNISTCLCPMRLALLRPPLCIFAWKILKI